MKDSLIYPFLNKSRGAILRSIKQTDEIYLFDVDNKKYIDGISGLWNVNLGYNHAQIIEAISNQAKSVPFVNLWSNTNETIISLADRLISKTEGVSSKLMYTTTGSEAVELSIKFARQYQHRLGNTRKKYVISFDLSYHGTTYGAISLTGIDKEVYYEIAPLLEGISHLETYIPGKDDINKYLDYLNQYFEKNHDKIAGIVLEPVLGGAGIIKIDDKVIEKINKVCKKYSILLISDEITTGFHRTGPFFGYQLFNDLRPDMICVSKGITNGYLPLGAVLLNDKIIDVLGEENIIPHFSTQNGNPICCAAANEVLNILESEDYETLNHYKSEFLYTTFSKSLRNIKFIKTIRYQGLMFGIELNRSNGDLLMFDEVWQVATSLKENGLVIYPYISKKTSGIVLIPSYTINEHEMIMISEIISKVLTEMNF